ncbi:MAG TPA: DUF4433 domain-containing protein [Longimicrobiaceae bacterium]|nr:DUF4433 domain-containing protein [Longimicrobiaceae bacterium]
MTVPDFPKIYHITHVDNLASIGRDGCLYSDAAMIARGGPTAAIGMTRIKRRRLEELEVPCHPRTKVGEYVPFYFCPRSVMLYLLSRGTSPDLAYTGGQRPIVHLEADLREVVAWTEEMGQRWAFSLANAGAYYTASLFRRSLDQLDQVNWSAVAANDWRAPEIKEGKQAEFLVYGSFPWTLVRRIGVSASGIRNRVVAAMEDLPHQPRVEILPAWYY